MSQKIEDLKVVPALRGLYTSKPSNKIPDGFAANVLNIDFSNGGTISPMKGYTLVGNVVGDGECISEKNFIKGDNNQILLALMDDYTNAKLYWLNEVLNRWEQLSATNFATGKRMGWAPFNGTGSNLLVFCNGVQNYSTWRGAIAYYASDNGADQITVTVDSPYTTLALAGFPNTGSIIINGTTITYTGISALTFTGCSAVPAAPAVGHGIAIIPDETTYSALPKGNLLLAADGRVWMAGAPAAPNRLYYSEVGVGTNFTVGNNPGDPGLEDFPDGRGKINSLGVKEGFVIIIKQDLVRAFRLDYPSLTEKLPIRKTLFSAQEMGGSSEYGIIGVYNDLAYVSTLGGVRRLYVPDEREGFKADDWTQEILPTSRSLNWDKSAAGFFPKNRIIVASARSELSETKNDKVVYIQFHEDAEGNTVRDIGVMDWFTNCWENYRGDFYFASANKQAVYKAFDGYSKDGSPYSCIYTTKSYDFGEPFMEKKNLITPAAGKIGPGTDLNLEMSLDTGARGVFTGVFHSTDTDYIFPQIINTIGAFEIGVEPLGGTIDDIDELDKFLIFFTTSYRYSFYEVQLTVSSSGSGQRWTLEDLGFSAVDSKNEIPKKLKKSFNAI